MTKKIPTIIGLFGVLSTVVILSIAINYAQPYLSKANPVQPPQNVTFSNITDSSFTVSWQSNQPATGFIKITDDKNKSVTSYDDRDIAGQLETYTTHFVTIRNLLPQTTYSITIFSDSKEYSNTDSYTLTTAPSLTAEIQPLEPSFGSLTYPDGNPAEGAIVFVQLEGSQRLSTLVTPSGTWVVPLNRIRKENLQDYVIDDERMTETIHAFSDKGEAKAITDTLNDNPVPAMDIGKEYDFRNIQAQSNEKPPQQINTVVKESNTVAILQPKENAAIPTDLPLFQGTGIPETNVSLVLGITNPQTGTTTVGNNGIWRFTPKKPLSAGKQSITITTTDQLGKPIALTAMFEILKSGTQVLGDATPSGTLATTPTITLTPSPTASPSSNLVADPPPVSGIEMPLFLLLCIGIALFASGVMLII